MQQGLAAEAVVAKALQTQGWVILAHNLRQTGFELDLVVKKGSTIAIVEVKAARWRPRTERTLQELLPHKKREALRRGAAAIASRLRFDWQTIRIDVAVVYRDALQRPQIDYHVDALTPY